MWMAADRNMLLTIFTGLTVDYLKDHRVFWCDGKTNTIWTMDKDGGDISRIIADSSKFQD